MPRQGTAVATFTNPDGEAFTLIIPAIRHGDQIIIDADHQATALFAMRAAGVDEVEFEFTESDD